ncbi:MAG TPA: MerR family DNA-binding transcriptional regulator [Phenylobacterium sp.]|uniref:MerR family transcriptional regulator n=1 Tax=Phenylobacterium sp. TaxID=1871053 RepID=UPI002D046FFD|nr:MerR family DNA-binding transcriptional regulator [Phenylobacterium sp.]HQN52579.1 MerR family DNA-binding transcriptional regulator [Phenylobacterium sp.]
MPLELRRPARTFTIRQLCQEFKCTPRALRFYEDKGLLTPARDGMNRVYSYKDRARLQLILRGKRVGLSLQEIGEILDLYEVGDNCAAQNARSLAKFRERIVALEVQRKDIDDAIDTLVEACNRLEQHLANTRPDLLPQAADYDQVLRARLGDHPEAAH